MSRTLRPASICLALLAAAVLLGGAPAGAARPDGVPARLLAQSLRFRHEAGLRADPGYVRGLVAKRGAYRASISDWGVPLTPAESANLAKRDRVEARLPLIRAWVARHAPRSFAGLWVDQRAGGLVRVGFTRGANAKLAQLRRAFPYPAELRAFTARWSAAQLGVLAARVRLDPSLGMVEVGPDPANDAVTVGVRRPTAAIATTLRRRYPGVPLRVVAATPWHAAATERYDTYPAPPMIGALEIRRPTSPTRVITCSAGFVAQGSINPRHFWLLSAGHCGNPGTTWYHRTPTGRFVIGRTDSDTLTTGSDSDAEVIALSPRARRDAIYINDSDIRRISWQQRFDEDFVGQAVCRSGAGSFDETGEGNACGFIQFTDMTVLVTEPDGTSHTLVHQRVARLPGCAGDSGGPLFKLHTAMGIVSAGNGSPCGDRTTYSQIGHIARRLHVHVDGARVTNNVR